MPFERTRSRSLRPAIAAALAGALFAVPAAAWRTGPFIVFFGYDSVTLEPHAAATLDNLVRELAVSPEAHMIVRGHTDRTGLPEGNLLLSCRRARTVRAYLLGKGIASDRMVIQGYGEEDPDVPTEDGVREPQNRRVAFTFGTAAEIEAARADPRRC